MRAFFRVVRPVVGLGSNHTLFPAETLRPSLFCPRTSKCVRRLVALPATEPGGLAAAAAPVVVPVTVAAAAVTAAVPVPKRRSTVEPDGTEGSEGREDPVPKRPKIVLAAREPGVPLDAEAAGDLERAAVVVAAAVV